MTADVENQRVEAPPPPRWGWLDQYRGYTVLSMFLVNFAGSYPCVPPILRHHHTWCSFADTVMPQFLFMVGVAYRLTFMRRMARSGRASAARHALGRNAALLMVALVVHGLGRGVGTWAETTGPGWLSALAGGFKRQFFQTLTHIAVTSLWVLPVIGLGVGARMVFATACALLHVAVSWAWYHAWVNEAPAGIDGGPLGFLTWTIPLLTGSIAADLLDRDHPRPGILAGLAAAMMAGGYAVSCLGPGGWTPPFFPAPGPGTIWSMSQRSGSVSYLLFGGGFALMVALLFAGFERRVGWRWPVFTTLGINALAGYVLHDLIAEAFKPWVPKDSPLGIVALATGAYLAVCWLFLRHLEKTGVVVRL